MAERDYSYIEYYRKAVENSDAEQIFQYKHTLNLAEAVRDFRSGSLRRINHLIQYGKPNMEIKEARWDIYKVSASFHFKRKNHPL